jgi:hypothetical protein
VHSTNADLVRYGHNSKHNNCVIVPNAYNQTACVSNLITCAQMRPKLRMERRFTFVSLFIKSALLRAKLKRDDVCQH